jgi:adenylate/nucleoside-diphosphate kinase
MCARLGDFGQYCPVSLALYDELVNCAHEPSMDFVAEYQGYYYKMFSQKELDLFLDQPEKFVPPQAPRKLPAANMLPAEKNAQFVVDEWQNKRQKPIELMGYCPVTFYEGQLRYEAIEEGSKEFAALYKDKMYVMKDVRSLDKFMRKPELYAFLKLPHKLPPLKKLENQINVFNLPITGYLEQTVADLLKRSLNEVGEYKPKFPFITPSRSALLYVAYYLKAYNPKSTEYRRKKYRQKLSYFKQKCELINFLYKETTVKYKDPSKRTEEYNIKLESFFSLQDNAPTMNWLA